MSVNINTVKDALAVAIQKEIDAYKLYMDTAIKVASSGTKKMLEELALQEKGHQKILEKVVLEDSFEGLGANIPQNSLGIAEFLVASEIKANATPQEVLIFAMKEEEKAFNFYTDLKAHFVGTELEGLFDGLAKEEKGHKTKLEQEYEDNVLREN